MDKIKCKSYLETSKFKIQISRPRGYQEPDTQVASLGCTHYSRALAPLDDYEAPSDEKAPW